MLVEGGMTPQRWNLAYNLVNLIVTKKWRVLAKSCMEIQDVSNYKIKSWNIQPGLAKISFRLILKKNWPNINRLTLDGLFSNDSLGAI